MTPHLARFDARRVAVIAASCFIAGVSVSLLAAWIIVIPELDRMSGRYARKLTHLSTRLNQCTDSLIGVDRSDGHPPPASPGSPSALVVQASPGHATAR